MSLPVHVDAYSGYKANERPSQFVLDEEIYGRVVPPANILLQRRRLSTAKMIRVV
jgi:hypothetical protein